MDRDLCLIVNPTAGAGRAAKLLARRRGRAARAWGCASASSARPRWSTRASARAPPRPPARSPRRWAATASRARWRASCATAPGVLAVLPGGRGNDFARKLGIPADPVAACALLRSARAAHRPRRGRRPHLPRDPQRRPGLRRQPDRQREHAAARHRRLRLRGAARARRLEARALDRDRRRRDPRVRRVLRGRGQLRRLRRRHVPRPRRDARRRAARRRARRATPQAPLPRQPAEGLQGHPRATSRACTSCAGAASPSTPTGRSRPTRTATRSPSCPPPIDVVPGTLRVLAP